MKKMQFVGDAKVTGIRKTDDGYLVGRVRCARTGIQHYNGSELGRDDLGVVALYRPEDEVFSKDSLHTYAGRPVTNDHPPEQVNSQNWKRFACGDIGEDILRDGEYVNVPITMMDEALIQDFEAGKKEISMGYTHMVDFVDGETPSGEPYQAVSRDLRMNHLAIVDRGRAGHECRVGDSAVNWGVSPLTIDDEEPIMEPKNRTVIVDGLSVVTTEQGAQAIDKIQRDKASVETELSNAQTAHDTALAAKDAELASKDAEIKKLKDAKLDQTAIDALVADRTDLIQKATLIAEDEDFSGKTDDEVRHAAVVAVAGADSVEGKTADYVNARFDIAVEEAQTAADADEKNPIVGAVVDSKSKKQTAQDNGQGKYEENLEGAWKDGGDK